jgi:hypothetical protein
MGMWAASLVAANAAIRIGYGIRVLVAPSKPAFGSVPLAPDTEELPEARLFVRGFAAHQIGVALLGLASLVQPKLRRAGMLLAATTDFADIVSAAVEAAARGSVDSDLRDGIAFSSAGLLSALAAVRET